METCAIPAHAVRLRLQQASSEPSWAVYLPTKARRARIWLSLGDTPGQRRCPLDGAGKLVAPLGTGPPGAAALFCASVGPPARHAEAPSSSSSSRGPAQREAALLPGTVAGIVGSVWAHSRTPAGCRLVQQALEEAETDESRDIIACELQGRVWDALRCPHANFVLQKCIVTARPESSQFIIDELLAKGEGAIAQAARHRYGCRIVERLLERCEPHQVDELINDILDDALALCMHPYGNYVVQHLLGHARPDQQDRLGRLLVQHIGVLGEDGYARAVIGKALAHAPLSTELARAIAAEKGLLVSLSRTRQGQVSARLVVQALEDPGEREAARRVVAAAEGALRARVAPAAPAPAGRGRGRGTGARSAHGIPAGS